MEIRVVKLISRTGEDVTRFELWSGGTLLSTLTWVEAQDLFAKLQRALAHEN